MSAVIVTGAGTGIGAAVATLLAGRGEQVVACGRRAAPLEELAEATGALAVQGDVATREGAAAVVEAARRRYGSIKALVLNAGVVVPGSVATLSREDWDLTIGTNLTAPFLMLKEALPDLLEHRGAVVAVGSVAGLRAGPDYVAYGASKAGLHMLVQDAAVDLGPQGVRINCVAPGWVRTEMADAEMAELAAATGTDTEGAYGRVTAAVPMRRPAAAAEVAEVIAWLLSPASSYVHGAVLPVDGGTSVVDAGAVAFLGPSGPIT